MSCSTSTAATMWRLRRRHGTARCADDNRDLAFMSEHRRNGVPNRELQLEFDAFQYCSTGGEDEDGSTAAMEMAGGARGGRE
jgi:hypothetical protein